ncbi:MAG: S49 family peptidase [Patescibacteria group bacterium]|nr:S49 family peptidase [Patescibacteria group bacterium]
MKRRGNKERILSIDLDVPIDYKVCEEIYNKIAAIKPRLILLKINSPGGVAAASFDLYEIFKKYRDNGGKIITYVKAQALSGAFLIAMASNTIIANPISDLGSIGAIIEIPYQTKNNGEKIKVIKTGKHKDIFSGLRSPTKSEIKQVLKDLKKIYNHFCEVIVIERKMPLKKIRGLADGRIIIAEDALNIGLIDKIGFLPDFYEEVLKNLKTKTQDTFTLQFTENSEEE